eukprot:TRINITY_DN121249_c0_g1_i1.p1 TRINITY_DN121249_c0_g1~~TRINITY_DN121249_c0_g1_i1.p1  ORF type:complete len:266 (+),score=57.55 TRINITY_DN121249_c0_g1_i1:132-929(+)
MTDYTWSTAETRRAGLLRKKQEKEAHKRQVKNIASQLGQEYVPTHSDPDADHEERIVIPEGMTGIVIGKKGENLKDLEKRHKVRVKLTDQGSEKVAIVTGKLATDVAAAVHEIDFGQESVDVPVGTVGWTVGKKGRHLKLLRELTGVTNIGVHREGEEKGQPKSEEDEEGNVTEATASGKSWIELKGRRQNVADARMLLEAHMAYYPVYQEMDEVERDLDRKIATAQARLGRRPGTGGAAGSRNSGASQSRGKAKEGEASGDATR